MKKGSIILIGLTLIVLAVWVQFQQYTTWGSWWDMTQFLHHESFSFGLVCLGVGMFAAVYLTQKRRRSK